MPSADPKATSGHLLVDRELRALCGSALRAAPGARALAPDQVQPASVDLRLGAQAYRVSAGFLPGPTPVEERIAELSQGELSLEGQGAVLERGLAYLVPLEEELALPPDLSARFNPRSSTGRCDLFTRVLCPGHARFDEAPPGWAGRLWLEVSPLSFPVRLRHGDRLAQLRLQRGRAVLTASELVALHRATPLCFDGERPLAPDELRLDEEGGLELHVRLADLDPAGWRAATHTEVLRFSDERAHDARDFFEPVHAPAGRCILAPGSFTLFVTREHLRVPPAHAAEMLPVDVGIGELRNNYAGFIDAGFGWREDRGGSALPGGTPAVLEVRAHDVPFLVEDGQAFCRLRFLRCSARPEHLYSRGRAGDSYQEQGLTLARAFRGP